MTEIRSTVAVNDHRQCEEENNDRGADVFFHDLPSPDHGVGIAADVGCDDHEQNRNSRRLDTARRSHRRAADEHEDHTYHRGAVREVCLRDRLKAGGSRRHGLEEGRHSLLRRF